MLLRFLLVLSILSFSLNGFGQNTTESEIWPQYYIQVPLVKDKWSVLSDYSHRYSGLFEAKTQWIARAGISYNLKKNISVAAGYAYSEYFSVSGVRRENRPWQQVQLDHKVKQIKLNHRMRLEERYQTGGKFNYRLRYQALFLLPLLPEQRLAVTLSDEFMLNFGKQVSGNQFDQNRLQLALQIKLAKHLFLAPAYLYSYQIQSNKKDFRNINILRTGLLYKR